MKKIYSTLEIEIKYFFEEDIVRTSNPWENIPKDENELPAIPWTGF